MLVCYRLHMYLWQDTNGKNIRGVIPRHLFLRSVSQGTSPSPSSPCAGWVKMKWHCSPWFLLVVSLPPHSISVYMRNWCWCCALNENNQCLPQSHLVEIQHQSCPDKIGVGPPLLQASFFSLTSWIDVPVSDVNDLCTASTVVFICFGVCFNLCRSSCSQGLSW